MRAAASGRLPAIQLEISQLVHPDRLHSPADSIGHCNGSVFAAKQLARRAFITSYLASWMELGHVPLLGMAGHLNRRRCRISIRGKGVTSGLSENFPFKTSIDCR